MKIVIRRYYKYILLLIIFVLIIIFYVNSNKQISTKVADNEILKDNIIKTTTKKETHENIYVDVKGAVNKPGVYEINKEKRVIDAINLAGGLLETADTVNLNLSKKLTDEMYIVVYTKDEIYNYEKNKNDKNCPSFECVCPDVTNDACIEKENTEIRNSNDKISINNASKEELMTLPGIGDAKANSIIEYRNNNGNFKTIDEIKNVSGIGDSIYEKIKDYITT